MTAVQAPIDEQEDGRPIVPLVRQSNWAPILFAVVLAAGGGMLFSALNAERTAQDKQQTVTATGEAQARITSAPPLGVPTGYLNRTPLLLDRTSRRADFLPPAPRNQAPQDYPRYIPPPSYIPLALPPAPIAQLPPPASTGASFNDVFDQANNGRRPADSSGSDADRVIASRLINPAYTVPRGTVIPAVLETALDSTRPGPVRGLVQRDVHSYDGSRVLIPRGSRLYGEYKADLAAGQRRAAVQWVRLLRPDGVTIELDSPASDPLGRAGVKGKVDSKFFQRFSGAILQSFLDVGVGLVTRQATDGVIVALPGSSQSISGSEEQDIKPSLKVRQGTSLSVFVAHDLDFSNVDQ